MLWIGSVMDIATVFSVQLPREESLLSRLVHTAWPYHVGRGQLYPTHHSKAVELRLHLHIPILPRGLDPVSKLRPNNGAAGSGPAKIMKPWKTAWHLPPSMGTHPPHTGNSPAIP